MLRNARRLFRQYAGKRLPVFVFSCFVLFWTLADALGQYAAPLLIEAHGFSATLIGFIIGTSSITGALFDFIISKYLKQVDFRRTMLALFVLCFAYPLFLWNANSLTFFLLAMALWGIYFDLYSFSVFNFISRYTTESEHVSGFGMIQIFRALGAILAPVIAGLVIIETVDWRSAGLYWVFIAVAFLFFLALLFFMRHKHPHDAAPARRANLLVELHLWKRIGSLLLPILFLTFYLFTIDAFFWTLMPLYAEHAGLAGFGGLLLVAYILPTLFVGWFADSFTTRFGKKRTAYICLFIGSLILCSFAFIASPYIKLFIIFFASIFTSMALPAINASYAEYISKTPRVEGEIEGLEDFSANLGYVVGPMLAGLLADLIGMDTAFTGLGLVGAGLAAGLLLFAPRRIRITT